jgi:site-specific DNA recombinase
MRCAIYIRVSTDEQAGDDHYSLPTQERQCREYAKSKGWTVSDAHVYSENHTGMELFQRDQMTLLRRAMGRGDFDVVLVYALDRLARRVHHQGVVFSEAEMAHVTIDSVTEDIDNSPAGVMLRTIAAIFAEMEREKIYERTQRGKAERLNQGKIGANGPATFGYSYNEDNTRLIPNEDTAPIVQYIFKSALDGMSAYAIAKELTRRGIKTPRKETSAWNGTTVMYIIRNPTYKGEVYGQRYESFKGTNSKKTTSRRLRHEDDWVLIPGGAPSLVSPDEWATAQVSMEQHKGPRFTSPPADDGGHLFYGTRSIVCVQCNRTLSRKNSKRKRRSNGKVTGEYFYPIYEHPTDSLGPTCKHMARSAQKLDRELWTALKDRLRDPEPIIEHMRNRIKEDVLADEIESLTDRIAIVRAEHGRLTANMLAMWDRFTDDTTRNTLMAQVDARSKELVNLEAERDQMVVRHENWLANEVDTERAIDVLEELAGVLDEDLTLEDIRLLIEAFEVQVQVNPDGVLPRWVMDVNGLPSAPTRITSEDEASREVYPGSPTPSWSSSLTGVQFRFRITAENPESIGFLKEAA